MMRKIMNTQDDVKAFEEAVFADADKWGSRELGADEAFVDTYKSKKVKKILDNANKGKTQLISIRMPVALVEDLKLIGESENLGYQTLVKNVLQRFVDAENRQKFNQVISEKRQLEIELAAARLELKQLKQA